VVSVIVLLKWHSWLQLVIECFAGGKLIRKTTVMEPDLEMASSPEPNGANFKPDMNFRHRPTWSLLSFLGFPYSPLSSSGREQNDLGGLREPRTGCPTVAPMSLNIHSSTETTRSPLHFLRVGQLVYNLSPSRLFTTINNRVKRILRPRPGAERHRIEWTCVSNSYSVPFDLIC
jgi:hypothetical protein